MNHEDYWERFFSTGAILDYLNYTACTSESEDLNIEEKVSTGSNKEGEVRGNSKRHRHGSIRNADRRL